MNNQNLGYIAQRFWDPIEGRIIKAEQLDFRLRLLTEQGTSKRHSFGGSNPVIWIQPTFMKDNNGKMIFQHDIISVEIEKTKNWIVVLKEGEWVYTDLEGIVETTLAYAICNVVGNMFEDASLMSDTSSEDTENSLQHLFGDPIGELNGLKIRGFKK